MLGATFQRGVTLIELIIGVAVLSTILALGVPTYGEWVQNTKLRNTAEAILNGLQLARAEAVSRNASVRFSLAAGGAWTVCVNDDPGVAGCTGQMIQSKAATEGSSSAVTLVADPVISDVDFGALGQGTVIAIDVDINTSVMPANRSRNLRVLVSGGNVRMCDPNVNSPDSRAC